MTQKINLTTRKKSLPEKFLGTFIDKNPANGKWIARYSQAYQPEGHRFVPAFKEVDGGYWLRHRILERADIGVLRTLQYLCDEEEPFTVEGLAEACRKSQRTLRQNFDNLINAELLEILTIGDGQGKPNYYIIRTPLFERAKFTPTVKNELIEANLPLPTVFLEDEAARLRGQVKQNRHKALRFLNNLKSKKDFSGFTPAQQRAYDRLTNHYTNQNLALHRVFKTLGEKIQTPEGEPQRWNYSKAVEFDRVVWHVTRTMPDTSGTGYWDEFKRRIKSAVANAGLKFTTWLYDLATELSQLYDVRQRKTAGSAKARSSAKTDVNRAPSPPEGYRDEYESADHSSHEEFLRQERERVSLRGLLREQKEKNKTWNGSAINDVLNVCRRFSKVLPFSEIERVASDVLPFFIAQKITVEKLE